MHKLCCLCSLFIAISFKKSLYLTEGGSVYLYTVSAQDIIQGGRLQNYGGPEDRKNLREGGE